jgi:hypothetical protein
MALRPEYRLVDAQFDDFLFASIGEEENGVDLTVLSALARLGLDPWGEAAKLSKLTREAATTALAEKIAALPKGHWKESDIQAIAVRLVNCLPKHFSSSDKAPQAASVGTKKPMPEAQKWMIWSGIAMALFMALSHLFGD